MSVRRRVVIAGGGVAGVEALLALHDMAGERAELTLLSPEPDFVMKPLLVEEPFGLGPAEQRALEPLASEHGAQFVQRGLARVDEGSSEVELDDGSRLPYDHLVVCLGGRYRPALEGVTTFPFGDRPFDPDEVLDRAAASDHRLAFVVPAGVTWSLPLYEIALMTQRRAAERGIDATLALITPEPGPLAVFGPAASAAIRELLDARGIRLFESSTVTDLGPSGINISPGGRALGPAEVVALPVMDGPAVEGLPADERGFIPIDEHARVRGADRVYAAGDGANFPIKQGGIATQQADAAAAHIAHELGAASAPEPFHPVLRGKLLTGDESVHMRTDVAGGGGEGEVSPDRLWWPPEKISGRYLAAWLHHDIPSPDSEPPLPGLDVEVALPGEWHEQPMLDSFWTEPNGDRD